MVIKVSIHPCLSVQNKNNLNMKTIKKISLAGFFLLGMLAFNVDAKANSFGEAQFEPSEHYTA